MPKILPSDFTETEIYRRHRADCKNPQRCQCPLWMYGYIHGQRVRESLKTTRFDVAVDRQRRREGHAPAPVAPPPPEPPAEPEPSNCSIEQGVQKFLDWGQVNGVTEMTLKHYRYDFRHFTQFCAAHKVRSPRAVTKSVAADFVLTLSKYSGTTRVTRFNLLRTLFRYWRESDWMGADPLPSRGPRPPRHGAHRPLDQREQRLILAASQTPEEKALIWLLVATGLRGVDVRRLRWPNLDLKQRMLRITPQKTRESSGQEVIIPALPPELIAALHALPRSIDSDLVLPQFASSRRHYMRVLSRLLARAQVQATGHDLRCTFAVERLHEGATLYDVSLLLGHASVVTTQRYYAKWENKQALTERLSGVMEKGRFGHFEKAG